MVIRLRLDCRKVMGDLATIAFVVPLFEIVGETPRMTFARNGSRAAWLSCALSNEKSEFPAANIYRKYLRGKDIKRERCVNFQFSMEVALHSRKDQLLNFGFLQGFGRASWSSHFCPSSDTWVPGMDMDISYWKRGWTATRLQQVFFLNWQMIVAKIVCNVFGSRTYHSWTAFATWWKPRQTNQAKKNETFWEDPNFSCAIWCVCVCFASHLLQIR